MDLYRSVFEVIDVRSFSSMWYWIALAVLWSRVSHYVIGVPYDLTVRAAKLGGQKMQDVEDLVRINVNRIMTIVEVSGLFSVALTTAALTTLLLLGAIFKVELAQALFLLAFPLSIIALMNIKTAHAIQVDSLVGGDLVERLKQHRFKTQLIGMLSIFITAMWGMFHNMATGPLGG